MMTAVHSRSSDAPCIALQDLAARTATAATDAGMNNRIGLFGKNFEPELR